MLFQQLPLSYIPDIQEHYFEMTSVRTLILEQLYRKTVTRPLDLYNVNFKYSNKTQVEKPLHSINTRKACGHDIIIPQRLKSTTTINSGNIHLDGKWFR